VRVRRPHRSQMVGSARRSGPKPQARSAVSRTATDLFEFDLLFHRRGQATKVERRRPTPRRARHPHHLFSINAAAPVHVPRVPRRSNQ
jgi:hypothetical protein